MATDAREEGVAVMTERDQMCSCKICARLAALATNPKPVAKSSDCHEPSSTGDQRQRRVDSIDRTRRILRPVRKLEERVLQLASELAHGRLRRIDKRRVQDDLVGHCAMKHVHGPRRITRVGPQQQPLFDGQCKQILGRVLVQHEARRAMRRRVGRRLHSAFEHTQAATHVRREHYRVRAHNGSALRQPAHRCRRDGAAHS